MTVSLGARMRGRLRAQTQARPTEAGHHDFDPNTQGAENVQKQEDNNPGRCVVGGGVTPGGVTGVSAHVSGDCDFDYTGSAGGTYTNGPSFGTLTLPGTTSTLTISNVSGLTCFFAGIQNNDQASFEATYQVAADTGAYNPIQITSNP